MRDRRLLLLIALTCLAAFWIFRELASDNPVAHAQQSAAAGADETAVFQAETRLVLVDTVVTDKKGDYVRDLAQKDFKVWEDGKEQALTSFSFEESTTSTNPQLRYMVLFFDNSTMNPGDQVQARDAAAKFIDANAGPDRLIAIADFGGSVHISQNFTADAQRLKQVVAGLQGSSVSPNAQPPLLASLGAPPLGPSLSNAEADFGVQSVLLALRSLAKSLSTVPGRKSLVMLTSGFKMNPEYQSELTAVIDTCNRSNVAVYPIDVRGLVAPNMAPPHGRLALPSTHAVAASYVLAALHDSAGSSYQPMLRLAAFAEAAPLAAQHGGGGGGGVGGGGGHGGGGNGGGGNGGGWTGGGGTGGGGTGGGGKTGGGGTTGGGTTGGGTPGGRTRGRV